MTDSKDIVVTQADRRLTHALFATLADSRLDTRQLKEAADIAFARHRIASTEAERARADKAEAALREAVEHLECLVGETLGGDLSRDDESAVSPRGSYSTWITWKDRWAARDFLTNIGDQHD